MTLWTKNVTPSDETKLRSEVELGPSKRHGWVSAILNHFWTEVEYCHDQEHWSNSTLSEIFRENSEPRAWREVLQGPNIQQPLPE